MCPSAEIVKLKSEHKEFTASTLSFLILLKFGLGCPFHHISERGMLAVCIVVGLILFCINPFIVIAFLKLEYGLNWAMNQINLPLAILP